MNPTICTAIQRHAVLHFNYDGGPRTVEPHAHGTSTAGHEVLRAYQTSGFSRSGAPTGWRLFDVGKMRELRIGEDHFASPRPQYNPHDSAMTDVHCHV